MKRVLFVTGLLAAFASAPAQAAVIFNETYDAGRILSEGVLGDRTSVQIGSSVQFGPSNSFTTGAAFLEIPIFSAGILSAGEQYTVTLSVEENRGIGSLDQDAFFTINDGTGLVALQHFDNTGGGLDQFYGTVTAGSPDVVASGAVSQGAVTNIAFNSWTSIIEVGITDSIRTIAPINRPEFFSAVDIDPSQGLVFQVFGGDVGESYGLTSVTITVEGPESVPAPGAFALLGLGLIGVRAVRRG